MMGHFINMSANEEPVELHIAEYKEKAVCRSGLTLLPLAEYREAFYLHGLYRHPYGSFDQGLEMCQAI